MEQNKQLGINASCLLHNVTPKQAKSVAVIQGMLNCLFHATAAACVIGQLYKAHLESLLRNGQMHSRLEFNVLETQTWCISID